MRNYYVTVWLGDGFIQPYEVSLSESEKANVKTFEEKIGIKYWHTIIGWSLEE